MHILYCPKSTPKILEALERGGVDICELGLPFSDPLADGPIIQEATNVALAQGSTTDAYMQCLKAVGKKITIPLVAMSYYNPIIAYGMKKFMQGLAKNQVGATIIVDLPLEESSQYISNARCYDLTALPQDPTPIGKAVVVPGAVIGGGGFMGV